MKVNLSLVDADTNKEYHKNGGCVVRNLIAPDWIACMSAATDRICNQPRPGETLPEINLADGESMHGELFPAIWPR